MGKIIVILRIVFSLLPLLKKQTRGCKYYQDKVKRWCWNGVLEMKSCTCGRTWWTPQSLRPQQQEEPWREGKRLLWKSWTRGAQGCLSCLPPPRMETWKDCFSCVTVHHVHSEAFTPSSQLLCWLQEHATGLRKDNTARPWRPEGTDMLISTYH